MLLMATSSPALAAMSASSFPRIPTWLGIQQKVIDLPLLISWLWSFRIFKISGFSTLQQKLYPRYHPYTGLAPHQVVASSGYSALLQSYRARIRYILSQFLTPALWKKCWGTPVPGEVCAGNLARLGHSLSRVKISGRSTPRGRNMVFRSSEKVDLVGKH